jgi:para-aminobenzoate synthetase component 1
MLNWGNRFNICCFLDNHEYHESHSSAECILAAGSLGSISENAGSAFEKLQSFYDSDPDWIFGFFAYDLKNEIESLSSQHSDGIGLPDLSFFVPRVVVQLSGSALTIGTHSDRNEQIFEEITNAPETFPHQIKKPFTNGERYSKSEYIATVERLKEHILKGDCYEVNLCQEFFIENIEVDALSLYNTLSNASPNPFSAFYKNGQHYLLCMSPERYLKRQGSRIFSQPMKGTAKRDPDHPQQDLLIKQALAANEKERAENIMVVDLVRNDLSKICIEGTVKVDELCKVYSFPQVHQMISTVSGDLNINIKWTDAVKATFPMGSMTGAPKKKVMELIEKYERSKRGLFSGSLGYVTPEGNFDFNVVIRSVLYNALTGYLSFHTGSAITFSSDAEKEYEECLLKAAAIKKALAETNTFH